MILPPATVTVTCTGPHWVWATEPVTVFDAVLDPEPVEPEEAEPEEVEPELVEPEPELVDPEEVDPEDDPLDPVVASYDDPLVAALGPEVEVL
ncbi:hypothetical protein GCM10027596_04090 [Nocardioides korecus]